MARIQTLMQLTDDLVRQLDEKAAHGGRSRSELIREAIEHFLVDDRRRAIDAALIAGYERMPQIESQDAWGDLNAWTEANCRRNRAALDAEEQRGW